MIWPPFVTKCVLVMFSSAILVKFNLIFHTAILDHDRVEIEEAFFCSEFNLLNFIRTALPDIANIESEAMLFF